MLAEALSTCVSWKHATYALAGLLMASGGGLAWLDNELDQKVEATSLTGMKEDIKIIKECLIKKECG
jgi:hypothetical protein